MKKETARSPFFHPAKSCCAGAGCARSLVRGVAGAAAGTVAGTALPTAASTLSAAMSLAAAVGVLAFGIASCIVSLAISLAIASGLATSLRQERLQRPWLTAGSQLPGSPLLAWRQLVLLQGQRLASTASIGLGDASGRRCLCEGGGAESNGDGNSDDVLEHADLLSLVLRLIRLVRSAALLFLLSRPCQQ
jgi:hypothetical protein